MSLQHDFDTSMNATADRKFFTVDEANRALPYVSRIVEDVRRTYRRAIDLQEQIEHPLPGAEEVVMQRDYAAAIDELNRYVDELGQVGVELKDYDMGLIDFPAMHEGREVCLCWKRGENSVAAWHETDAGFAGRQSVELLDEQPADD